MKRLYILIAATLILCGCSSEKEGTHSGNTAVNVEVYTASVMEVSDKVTYTGEIKAADSVSVSSKVSAKAASVLVNEGDYVNAGDTLAVLDKTDISLSYEQALASYNSAVANYNMMVNSTAQRSTSQAEQGLKSAEIAYNTAKNNYERELSLYNQNSAVTLAQQGYNDAKAAYDRAKQLYENNTNLIAAKNAYQTAQDNYKRCEELYSKGAISQLELDNSRISMENAKASLDTVEANNKASLDSANSAMISAKENLENTKITAKAALQNAQANLESAKVSLDNAKENIGLTKTSNTESIKTAKATVNSARAALNIAKNNLNNTSITAPISGYVASKNIAKGQMAAAGVEIFTIKNSNTVDAEIKVTESVIPTITTGTKAVVSVKSANIEEMGATVTLVNPVKDERTGMYTVKVTMDNSDNKLNVGMFADITLITNTSNEAVVIPSEAVMQSGEELYVYIAKDNTAHKCTVTTGIEEEDMIEVTSGIVAGDKVIVSGKDYISETNNEINIVSEQ